MRMMAANSGVFYPRLGFRFKNPGYSCSQILQNHDGIFRFIVR